MVNVKPFKYKNSDNLVQDGSSPNLKKSYDYHNMIEILARQPKIKSNLFF